MYHYMDDILIAAEQKESLISAVWFIWQGAQSVCLQIAEEKVQLSSPWKYLGWKITPHTIDGW